MTFSEKSRNYCDFETRNDKTVHYGSERIVCLGSKIQ